MRRALAGAVGGALALGAALGLTAERYALGRTRMRPDPLSSEPFFRLPADRIRAVPADDGVALHVEEVGPQRAELTMVFLHGYTQELAAWHFQRRALADGTVRLVFYDARSHGRSGRGAPEHATIDQLGRDLLAVLDACAPTGRVVLVGHSLGGMTIMALADRHPELFGDRVAGVGLLSTSTGKLASLSFGLPAAVTPVTSAVLPWVTRGMRARPRVFEHTRRLGTDLGFLLARRGAFGSPDVSPVLVEFVEKMTADCPVEVIAQFYDTFRSHDKLAAIEVLGAVEALILVGGKDLITPVRHSQVMAEFVPTAEYAVIEGAGHMVQLEQPAQVNDRLRGLLARAARDGVRTA